MPTFKFFFLRSQCFFSLCVQCILFAHIRAVCTSEFLILESPPFPSKYISYITQSTIQQRPTFTSVCPYTSVSHTTESLYPIRVPYTTKSYIQQNPQFTSESPTHQTPYSLDYLGFSMELQVLLLLFPKIP